MGLKCGNVLAVIAILVISKKSLDRWNDGRRALTSNNPSQIDFALGSSSKPTRSKHAEELGQSDQSLEAAKNVSRPSILSSPFLETQFIEIFKSMDVANDWQALNHIITVQNGHLFNMTRGKRGLKLLAILAVQVHARAQNVETLIKSLAMVRYIRYTLLIFSCDCYSATILSAIRSITFAPYIILRYPLTPEIYSKDLKRSIMEMGENNWDHKFKNSLRKWLISCHSNFSNHFFFANHTAKYMGLETNASYKNRVNGMKFLNVTKYSYTIIKHHWWWKLNVVAGQSSTLKLEVDTMKDTEDNFPTTHYMSLSDFNGPIILLEEDNYVLPDALHLLSILQRSIEKSSQNIYTGTEEFSVPDPYQNSNWEGRLDDRILKWFILSINPKYQPTTPGNPSSGQERLTPTVGPNWNYSLKLIRPINAILSLGQGYLSNDNPRPDIILLNHHISNFRNTGIVLNRPLWNKLILPLAEKFCHHNDYNWDWTFVWLLRHGSGGIFSSYALSPELGRIIHKGNSGFHRKKFNNVTLAMALDTNAITALENEIKLNAHRLFPHQVTFSSTDAFSYAASIKYGMWNLKEDHELCLKHLRLPIY